MAEKVTIMKFTVDLHCCKCYKKVKQVLCKFPQIRDQIFDEKQNIVTIKVVCCNPEKIRDTLCCKGGGAIKSIEIEKKETKTSKPPAEIKPPGPCKPPPTTPPEPAPPAPAPIVTPPAPVPIGVCCESCYEGRHDGPCFQHETPRPKPAPPIGMCCESCYEGTPGGPCFQPATPPRKPPHPIAVCCVSCYEGRPGGPCFQGYGGSPPCYDGYYYGRPVYDSCGGGRPFYVSRCDQYYFGEENTSGCAIM